MKKHLESTAGLCYSCTDGLLWASLKRVRQALKTESKSWSVGQVVQWVVDDLKKRHIDSPRLEAELIVSQAIGIDRIKVIIFGERILTPDELHRIRELVKRRRAYEPMAYLRGEREFYGRPFRVDKRVLVPRPDTEILVARALHWLKPMSLSARVLELCTGSGCVAISLQKEYPTLRTDAVDLSSDAIGVARANAVRLGAVWNLAFYEGNLFEPLPKDAQEKYQLIVANPPYIPSGQIEGLPPDVRDHEPHLALDGGEDGLRVTRSIVNEAPNWLARGGALALEIESSLVRQVLELFKKRGFEQLGVHRDYGGNDRVVDGVWRGL